MIMSTHIERINVIITRHVSPTEFWIKILTCDRSYELCPHDNADIEKQRTFRAHLRWIKDQAEWKCHLAFLIPVDCICWSLTAIDKFKSYVGQFKAFAITVPPTVDTSTRSTAVILWGLMHKQNDIIDIDAPEAIVWRNINLQLIFQGVARSIVHIDHLSSNLFMPWLNDAHDEPRNLSIIKRSHTNRKGQIHGVVSKKSCGKVNRWLPALPCRSKEFTGTPVFVDNNLAIYVQEWENRKCIEHISNVLTNWHQKHVKNPRRLWYDGEICVAQRNSDRMYYRAEIQRVLVKQRKCLVQWVDFGYTEIVPFEYLSTHIAFVDIPIQVRKCHLSNVNLISDQQTEKARELCHRLFCNQLCCIYIHDNYDVQQRESIACSVQSLNEPLDLSSMLISCGLVHYKAYLNRKFQVNSKRIRTESDEPIIKNSSELSTYTDFQEFYRTHKAKSPMDEINDSNHANDVVDDDDDDDSRTFEVFEPLLKRSPLIEKEPKKRKNIIAAAHPMVDRVTEHFKLMTIKKSAFHCRCVCIMDPVTILIEQIDAKPPVIGKIDKQPEYFPVEQYSPCVAYENYSIRRGIVWEKSFTDNYSVLFVDTLQIDEVHRNLIEKCPKEILGPKLPYAKVHLSQIKPNERMRALDICNELDNIIMGKELFAQVIDRCDNNGVQEIELFESELAKRPIYKDLIKQKFYKKIPK